MKARMEIPSLFIWLYWCRVGAALAVLGAISNVFVLSLFLEVSSLMTFLSEPCVSCLPTSIHGVPSVTHSNVRKRLYLVHEYSQDILIDYFLRIYLLTNP